MLRSIIAFAVNRWQISAVVFTFLVVSGMSALGSVPRAVDPHFPTPYVITTIVLPGVDAQQMEESIAKPLEVSLQGLDHLRETRSRSSDGVTVLIAEFDHGTDDEMAQSRVERAINAARGSLPKGIARIEYRLPRTTETAVLQLSLTSDGANWRRMAKYSRDISDRLNIIPGVRKIDVEGLADPEVQIILNLQRMAQTRIPVSVAVAALEQSGVELATGGVSSGQLKLDLDAGGIFRSLSDISRITVRSGDGRILSIGDIAEVRWGNAERRHITNFNGHRCLFISVKGKEGTDAIRLRSQAMAAIEQLRSQLPPDMRLEVGFDQSQDINAKLRQLARDFLIALGLVMITILPLGFRPALIVMLAIPLSLAVGVAALSLLGHSLNQISIAGFIIALGLLVDDAIVVTENIQRRSRSCDSPSIAAIEATVEIAPSVLGATLVLLLTFLPLALLPDASGDYVRPLPLAVLATVTSSLLISLTLIPFVSSRVLSTAGSEGNALLHFLQSAIDKFYTPLLKRAMGQPKRWFWSTMGACVAALALVPYIGFSLFPAADTPYVLVRVETLPSSSIESTDEVVAKVSEIISKEPLVVNRMSNTGAGNPQIFYNVMPQPERGNFGEIFLTLREWKAPAGPELVARLQHEFERFADARVTVQTLENGPSIEAPLAVRVSGPDLAIIKDLARQATSVLAKIDGLRELKNPLASDRLSLSLGLDEGKAGFLGVPAGEAKNVLRLVLSGQTVGRFRDTEGENWPVVMRTSARDTQPLSALEGVYVSTTAGSSVPLSLISNPTLKSVPTDMTRRNLQRSITVTAYNKPGVLVADLTRTAKERLARIYLPPGYTIEFGGEDKAANDSFAGFGGVLLMALFGVICVLVIEFGDFRKTFVALGVIPLGLFGGLIALFVVGDSLSFLAMIGFIALVGIEIKNSILLVDCAARLQLSGMELRDAIALAGAQRFMPILLTSATAIGGLLPLALGGSALYSPLAWVIIGGLLSSTLLSRIITPIMYLIVCSK
jgi:multidrug efflux pump subunit AcrB